MQKELKKIFDEQDKREKEHRAELERIDLYKTQIFNCIFTFIFFIMLWSINDIIKNKLNHYFLAISLVLFIVYFIWVIIDRGKTRISDEDGVWIGWHRFILSHHFIGILSVVASILSTIF